MNISKLIEQIKSTHKSKPLSDADIQTLTEQSGFKLPPSYLGFLYEFGNGDVTNLGSYQIFHQDIDAPDNVWDFTRAKPNAPDPVPVDGGSPVPKNSLFCLMTEDSNGGAWCWLTSEADADGEYPLAYYYSGTIEDDYESENPVKSLFYRVPNFTTWLEILVRGHQEVIRSLDVNHRLHLG
jgi:hypothetical protein